MSRCWGIAWAWVGLLAGVAPALGQDDPDAPRPGLVGRYAAVGATEPIVVRVDPALAWDWGRGAPDPRLPADGFDARWSGTLLVAAPGPHRFHARTDGRVRLTVGGMRALDGGPGDWTATAVDLPPGEVPITLEYRHDAGPARLAIDWEGPGFDREPLPARVLWHDPETQPHADLFADGRRLADRLGCANCHAVLDLPRHPDLGPPLDEAGKAIRPDWLAAWLADPAQVRDHPRMPGFGAGLDPAQVADLSAFLAKVARVPAEPAELRMARNVAEPARGRRLFRILGCLACHSRGPIDGTPAQTGEAPDLAGLGRKRDVAAIASSLARPKPDRVGRHRPDLHLNADDAANLAAYLAEEPGKAIGPPAAEGDAERGRQLAASLRCAACHEIPGVDPPAADIPLGPAADPSAGCLADAPARAAVPGFHLEADERAALRAFVGGLPSRPSSTPAAVLGEDLVQRLGCLGCHARDGRPSERLGPRLAALLAEDAGLGEWKGCLTPPDLTAVGAKLRPEMLEDSVRGRAPVARPWLAVRMPVYPFQPGEAERIVAFLTARDRPATAVEPEGPTPGLAPAAIEEAGRLVGRQGFGCVSCHVLAGKVPPGGEPETMGPDLALAHRRMDRAYFRRWLADPQRILPGTPMPQFVQPAPGHPGTRDEQLASIWALLGSPRLAEVASAGTREILRPRGDRASVVRDMVVWPEAPGGYFPRGVAIGLKNGRSLLFDADRLAWVGWWRGGFVSRTKSGRLWEWHPEGEPEAVARRLDPPVVFVDGDGRPHPPVEVRERFGSFAELAFEGDGVVLVYVLNGPGGATVRVRDRIRPRADGWERSVRVEGVPPGFTPRLAGLLPGGGDAGPAAVELKAAGPEGVFEGVVIGGGE